MLFRGYFCFVLFWVFCCCFCNFKLAVSLRVLIKTSLLRKSISTVASHVRDSKTTYSQSNDSNLARVPISNHETWGMIFISCTASHIPRSILWLNNLVNLDSNSASWGSTPHSGRTGRVISTQLWILHWSSRVLQSEPNHSPYYRLQGQISVGAHWIRLCVFPLRLIENSFAAPWSSPSAPN